MTQRRSKQKKAKYKIKQKVKINGHNEGPTENDTKKVNIEKVKIQDNTKVQKRWTQ